MPFFFVFVSFFVFFFFLSFAGLAHFIWSLFGIRPVPQTPRAFLYSGDTYMCEREPCQSALSTRLSTAPLLQGTPTPTAHRNAGRSQFTRDGNRESSNYCTPTAAWRRLLIKSNSFSPQGSLLLKEPAYSTIHPLHSTRKHWSFEPDRGSHRNMATQKKAISILYVYSRVA